MVLLLLIVITAVGPTLPHTSRERVLSVSLYCLDEIDSNELLPFIHYAEVILLRDRNECCVLPIVLNLFSQTFPLQKTFNDTMHYNLHLYQWFSL